MRREKATVGASPRAGKRAFASANLILELLPLHPHLNLADLLPLRHVAEDLLGDLGEQRAGDDRVHVASARLDFLAAAADGGDQGVVVGEAGLVVLADAV